VFRRVLFWLLWPGLFVYFGISRRTRVVLVDGNRMLLIKDRSKLWFGQYRWALPGGGLRVFEKPTSGAVREVREELGIELNPAELELLWQGRIGGYGLRYQGYFLLAHVSSAVQLRPRASEVAAAEWHAIDALEPAMVKQEVSWALKLLADKS